MTAAAAHSAPRVAMPVGHAFREYVMSQLRHVEGLGCQQMFGGVAIYQHGVPFAILNEGRLYFKTDKHTAAEFQSRKMATYRSDDDTELASFYRVPNDVLREPERLAEWAEAALLVANRQLDQ